MSIPESKFNENIDTIKTNRYGSQIRRSIWENLDYLKQNGGGGGGLSFVKLTKEEYDAIVVKDPNTIYYVVDGDKIIQYMGDTKMTSGTTAGGAIPYLLNSALTGFVGNATTVPGE